MPNSHLLKHRTVVLRRQVNGGLGLSIKVSREREGRKDERRMVRPANAFHSSLFQGGAEHNVPVVISKIFKDQVGKKEVPFSLLLRFKCGNSENS